jgi:hypothetical protein
MNIKRYKIIILTALLALVVIYETKGSIDRLTRNIDTLSESTREQRKEKAFKYMGYEFVKEIVSPIQDGKFMPHLQYISHDYGVRVFINGIRNEITRDLVIVIGLDNILKNRNLSTLKCERSYLGKKVQLKCLMPNGIYHVTGVKFLDDITEGHSYDIEYMSGNKSISSYVFSSDDVLHTKPHNVLKIPSKKFGYYEAISDTSIYDRDYLTVTIESDAASIPDFILTGHIKNIGDHYILKWDKKDARNYFAILKHIVDANGNISNTRFQEAIDQIMHKR